MVFSFCLNVGAQSKYNQNPTTKDTYKVTKIINLEYKYVPSIKELIANGTFIPSDPNEFKKEGPPKRISRIQSIFACFRSMGKIALNGPTWGREFFSY